MKFFSAQKKIVDSICKKCSKLEEEVDSYKQKYASTYADKEESLFKLGIEKEKI